MLGMSSSSIAALSSTGQVCARLPPRLGHQGTDANWKTELQSNGVSPEVASYCNFTELRPARATA